MLRKLGMDYQFVSRNARPEHGWLSYEELRQLDWSLFRLIVHITPLHVPGKWKDVPICRLKNFHRSYSALICVQSATNVTFAPSSAQGARVQNGLDMLHLQAEKAWEIWK